MYSIREKITHLRSLHAPSHADSDLALLVKLSPKHEELHIFQLSPTRYAEQILSALLDVAPVEDIRNNRRAPDDKTKEAKTKETKTKESKTKESKTKESKTKETKAKAETKPTANSQKPEAVEKKSSKKKTSTPKSTGATSKTATSK